MAHNELPQASADRVRAKINAADTLLTQEIKWLPTELLDGKRTKQEVEAILCGRSKEWAWDVFVTILREWAEIGIPPDDFEAIAKGQVESLSTHAEERVAAFVSGSQLSAGEVFRSVHELLPGLIRPYREENRFRFHSVMAGGEAAPKPATPQAGGAAARAEAGELSQEGGRPADNSGGSGARAESAFPARGASLEDRLRITSIDGSVRWINPSGSDPEASIWTPDDEKRISACVFDGRAAVRSELEGIFSGKEWPALAVLVEPFRRYAVAVFDVYASAYGHVARTEVAYQEALDQLLLPMVLRDLFGREWDRSPGEKVVRMLWQDGPDGKPEGREFVVVAGNDPDPTCVFYDLLSNAIEHRFRFFEPLPPPAPGDPPGINLTNLEWWRYIGLSARHSLAMAIKPYIEDRVAHWRFIYSPTVPPESDNARGEARSDLAQQPEHPESGAVMPPASMAVRASSSSGASAMDSPTRVKFEAGLALAEVTLAQDLKDPGPSLEIARKYVTSATLTLARCILTPHCAEPYEAIRRAYDFAEWFAAETMKTAWVWLCVFSEMDTSGKLKKYKPEGSTEDGAQKGMTEAELHEWHGCLSGGAQEALDEFVPEFWQERLKYFSGIASGGTPTESETPRATEDRRNPVASAQEPSDSPVNSAVPKQEELDEEARERALSRIGEADANLEDKIRKIDSELKNGDLVKEEVPGYVVWLWSFWAECAFKIILTEWAEFGLPPDKFESIVDDQIESISRHAAEWIDEPLNPYASVARDEISSSEVRQVIRDSLPGKARFFREQNRFRFASRTSGSGSKPSAKDMPARDAAPQASEKALQPDGGTSETAVSWHVKLRAARKKTGLSRPDVANRLKKIGTQITADAIKKHEEGAAMPRPGVRTAYASIYGVSENEIFPSD